MKALILTAGALGALGLGRTLGTDYEAATRLRVDTTTRITTESTTNVESDGGPRGGRGGPRSSSGSESRHVVVVDEYLEKRDGRPAKVRRTFDEVSFEGQIEFGDQSSEIERESPFDGVVLELVVDEDGEVEAEVVEGVAPDDELLEGHRPELALDALLPEGEVDAGDAWDLDQERIARALGFDLESALFPRPERSGDGGGERGRGGRRGGFGRGRMGPSTGQLFTLGEWEGTATLESLDEDLDGARCALIQIEIEGRGELPEPEFGGRGRFAAAPPAPRRSDFEIEAEGKLYYSLGDRRPVRFELEGKLGLERRIERDTERGSFVMSTTQEGTFTQTVVVTAEESE